MKLFWGLIVVLVLSAGVVAFWPAAERPAVIPAAAPGDAAATADPTLAPAASDAHGQPEPMKPEPAKPVLTPEVPTPAASNPAPSAPAADATPKPDAISLDAALDAATGKKDLLPKLDESPKPTEPATPNPEQPASTPASGEAKPAAGDANNPAIGPAPTIADQPDGAKLVDGRYAVKGDGTKEKPYEVTWEMLVSAQETYEPSAGKKTIPGRIAMLDGKHVKLTGYVAFPLAVTQPKELLSMLNQWDGCCIGVPPTPYDAVEVQLLDRVIGENRQATYGVVQGRLTVKPYVVGDWLVGLYLMTDAEFRPTQFGGT